MIASPLCPFMVMVSANMPSYIFVWYIDRLLELWELALSVAGVSYGLLDGRNDLLGEDLGLVQHVLEIVGSGVHHNEVVDAHLL